MASKYQASWVSGQENREFWNEVLVSKKIVFVNWTDGGIESLVLDSGEVVKLVGGPEQRATFAIQDDT